MSAFAFDFTNPQVAALTIALIYGLGSYIAYKTKAMVPMMMVASVVFLAGYWTGFLPTDLAVTSGFAGLVGITVPILLTHMGTLLDIDQLIVQWKTVLICLAGIVGIALTSFTLSSMWFGRELALSAAGPISGGMIAMIMVSKFAEAAGKPEFATWAALVVSFQSFIGMPIAAYALNLQAKKIVADKPWEKETAKAEVAATAVAEAPKKKLFPPLPKGLDNNAYIILFKLALIAWLGTAFGKMTEIPGSSPANYILNPYVANLLFGIIFTRIGFLEKGALDRGGAMGLSMLILMSVISTSLGQASMAQVMEMLVPLIGCLVIGAIGIGIGSILAGKMLKVDPMLSYACGLAAMFGFPGTYILSEDCANANSTNEVEKKAILDTVMPMMLVAGFATVTISSVIFTGIVAPLIW